MESSWAHSKQSANVVIIVSSSSRMRRRRKRRKRLWTKIQWILTSGWEDLGSSFCLAIQLCGDIWKNFPFLGIICKMRSLNLLISGYPQIIISLHRVELEGCTVFVFKRVRCAYGGITFLIFIFSAYAIRLFNWEKIITYVLRSFYSSTCTLWIQRSNQSNIRWLLGWLIWLDIRIGKSP